MAKRNIFISYDYDNDKKYKNILKAWDANKEFDFSFHDQSVDVSVNSKNAGVIKRAISRKINSSKYFLCIVGADTNKSKWVNWEIEKAKELGKKIIAVKIAKKYKSPVVLCGIGAAWALSFKYDSIKKAINTASPFEGILQFLGF